MAEIEQRDFVDFGRETAEPLIYSIQGGLYKHLKE